jgi:hypothetical protein
MTAFFVWPYHPLIAQNAMNGAQLLRYPRFAFILTDFDRGTCRS